MHCIEHALAILNRRAVNFLIIIMLISTQSHAGKSSAIRYALYVCGHQDVGHYSRGMDRGFSNQTTIAQLHKTFTKILHCHQGKMIGMTSSFIPSNSSFIPMQH